MPRRTLLTSLTLLALGTAAAGVAIDRRADLREAGIEARNPPMGEMVSVDGREVHVVIQGEGPDLVLLHGAGGSSRDFTFEIIKELSQHYRVFAFDRPGFGWSEQIDPSHAKPWVTSSARLVDQAAHLAKAARQLGADRPLVVGHSYGAAVALAWALEEAPCGVVVLSGATMPWPGNIDWSYRVLGSVVGGASLPHIVSALVPRRYVETALSTVFAPQPVPDGYLSRAGVMMATRANTLRSNARQVRALLPQVVELAERYKGIEVPVEILHGTEDKTVYAEIHAEPLANLLPNVNLTILDGIGHMPHHAVPNQVIDAIHRLADRAGLR